jgi:proliferating cell nuclear antigen
MEDSDKLLLKIQTKQTGAFRILIEALKEILTEANFIFDETGIKLMAMDSNKSILIHMKLSSANFEYYNCLKKVVVGVNMLNMFKLIKTMTNSEVLTLFIEKNNENKLGIIMEDNDKKSKTVYYMNLLDIDNEEIQASDVEFDTQLTLPSGDFQKIIRDMINIGENIEIQSIGSELSLSCIGDFASQKTTLMPTTNDEGGLKFEQTSPPETPTQGIFSLKYLLLFTKCTNLCNQINLYIKNDYPLIVKYDVASLGSIKLCLAPNT